MIVLGRSELTIQCCHNVTNMMQRYIRGSERHHSGAAAATGRPPPPPRPTRPPRRRRSEHHKSSAPRVTPPCLRRSDQWLAKDGSQSYNHVLNLVGVACLSPGFDLGPDGDWVQLDLCHLPSGGGRWTSSSPSVVPVSSCAIFIPVHSPDLRCFILCGSNQEKRCPLELACMQ